MSKQHWSVPENSVIDSENSDDIFLGSLLFVDDEKNILTSLRRVFRPLGYKIYLALSGKEGLEILKNNQIDLIISDMRMPVMDGSQFLEIVAKTYPETVRILLTGFSDMASTVSAVNKGKIHRYFSKPWDDDEIKKDVKLALATKHLEKENERLTKITEMQNTQLRDLNENLEFRVKSRTEELQQTADMLDLSYEELKESYHHIIKVFSSLISMRQDDSALFSQKVSDLAASIAKKVKMSEIEILDVQHAALLLELGKLSLPDKLLDRPVTQLLPQEKRKFYRHPINGQKAIMAVAALQSVGDLIRSHEEYFNGKGYPDNLKGQKIPLGSRILSISKDFYAMQRGRTFNIKFSEQDAISYVVENKDTMYDPELVILFVESISEIHNLLDLEDVTRLGTNDLKEGMKLARDFYSNHDTLLLTKGRYITDLIIEKLLKFEMYEEAKYEIYIELEEES